MSRYCHESALRDCEIRLNYGSDGWGYLSDFLKRLNINIDSQVFAFSKTSFQLAKIGPKTPRAIYFNDSVAVGATSIFRSGFFAIHFHT